MEKILTPEDISAMLEKPDNQMFFRVTDAFVNLSTAKQMEKSAEEKVKLTKAKLEKANEELLKVREDLKKIQKEHAEAFVAWAYRLSDRQDIPEENRNECKVCLGEYNGDERKESVLFCGHRFCHRCLTTLPNKHCPYCRKEFTAEQIIKLF